MSGEVLDATNCLKDFMYANVYTIDMRGNIELSKAKFMLGQLFRLYMEKPEEAPESLTDTPEQFKAQSVAERAKHVTDFIAGMTDRYASQKFKEHFLPEAWSHA